MEKEKKLKNVKSGEKPDPKMLKELDFFQKLGMLEMMQDMGLTNKEAKPLKSEK